ncbi:5694_t:CDS:2 [Ambispora gerdemannii]|uniref:5694_t:CDS:1 n=1 Tax=Ambispora gerdemannii TaxID=144530 RepID=A0A9N9F3N0_9GLOM|nr:5694_t:CDS:2 [Ambispora gerdemannii]
MRVSKLFITLNLGLLLATALVGISNNNTSPNSSNGNSNNSGNGGSSNNSTSNNNSSSGNSTSAGNSTQASNNTSSPVSTLTPDPGNGAGSSRSLETIYQVAFAAVLAFFVSGMAFSQY